MEMLHQGRTLNAGVVMVPTLSSPVELWIVITKICGATSGNKGGIMKTHGFQCKLSVSANFKSYRQVSNIRRTLADN